MMHAYRSVGGFDMRKQIMLGIFALGIATQAYADPQFAIQAPSSPPAPQAVVVVSCQIVDLGFDVLPDTVIHDVPTWRNLDWKRDAGGELSCKREIIEIQDQAETVGNAPALHHNFGEPTQCAMAALSFLATSKWDAHHANWAVIAVGCPSPITDENGVTKAWHLPGCPSHVPGNDAMPLRCKFDESVT